MSSFSRLPGQRRPVSPCRSDRTRRATPRRRAARVPLGIEALEDRTVPSLLGQSLFPADNPWNQNIANAPVAANSAAILNNIISHQGGNGHIHPDFGQDTQGSGNLYGIPYNVVHGNTTAKVNVVIDAYPGESDLQPAPIPANAVIEGDFQNGPNHNVGSRGDSHMIVFDVDNDVAYEFYQASRPSENADGKWHANQETVWDMKTDSFRTLGWTSADAAGLPILPGLVRPDEALPVSQGGQGVINHAIRFTLQNAEVLDQFIYPASHQANPQNANAAIDPPMGTRFRLKASVNISTLDPESQVIARAMQQYGLILADNGSNFFFSGASFSVNANNQFASTFDDNDIQDTVHGLKSLTFSDFEVVSLTPVVTGLSAQSGPAGTTVTVTGQNFSGAAGHLQVLFGNTPATSVTILDDGHVTAAAPPGLGTVDVRVQSGVTTTADASENFTSPVFGYGTSATSAADKFTYTSSAPATHFSVAIPANATSGGSFMLTLTALDASNLTAAGYAGTVHFTSTDPAAALPADYTFTANDLGSHTFTVTLNTAGGKNVAGADTANGSLSFTSPVTVAPGAVSLSRSTVAVAPSNLRVGGTATVTLTARDAAGNLETAGGLAVAFGLSGVAKGTFGPVTDNKNGTYTATLTATGAGAGTVTATVGGRAVTSTAPTITSSPESPPVLQPIPNVSLPHDQFPASVTAHASSPLGYPLTYSATAAGDSLLFDLQSQYAFTGTGAMTAGATAYVLHSNQPGPGVMGYYLLRPADGALFAYDGSGSYAHCFNATPLATLGAVVYADPTLLLNARAPVEYATLAGLEGQYQFTQQGAGYYMAGAQAFVLHAAANNAFGNPYYLIRPSDGALFAYDGSASYTHSFASGSPVATLGADLYAHPDELLNARATPALYAQLAGLEAQYDFQGMGMVTAGATAYVLSAPLNNAYGNPFYLLKSDGSVWAYDGSPSYATTFANAANKIATLDPSVYANPVLLTGAKAPPDIAGAVTIDNSGNLSIGLANGNYVGTFKVTVGVSDGQVSVSQAVPVTSTDVAPTVTVLQNGTSVPAGGGLSFAHGSFPQTFSVGTADADGDTVVAGAAVSGNGPLAALRQQYRFQGLGYMTAGATAYVLQAAGNNAFGNPYYLLRSDGALYPYDGSGSYANMSTGTPLATLGALVYADPSLLTGAQPPVDYATLYGVQQQYQFTSMGMGTVGGITVAALHSSRPGPGAMGYYLLRADGGLFPYDGSGTYDNTTAGTPLATLGAAVYMNPSLLTGASAAPGLYAQLAQAEQRYDFAGVGYALAGAPAFVLKAPLNNANGNPFYLLRADGTVWAYDGSGSYAHTFASSANLVATLDPSVYANPALLTSAKAPLAATGVTASLSSGTLTVNSPSSFVGTFEVTLTATDGIRTTTQSFFVTATDAAPAPAAVAPQPASRSGSPLQVTLGASDADGDAVTFAAQAAGYSAAYALQQQYHFQGIGSFMTPDGVTAYVLQAMGTNANGNPFYLLKSDGTVWAYDGSGSYGHTFGNSANRVTTLDPSVFANPMLLTNAVPPSAPAAAVSVSGNTLTVNVSAVPAGTVFQVFVTANDGAESTRTSFLVTVTA